MEKATKTESQPWLSFPLVIFLKRKARYFATFFFFFPYRRRAATFSLQSGISGGAAHWFTPPFLLASSLAGCRRKKGCGCISFGIKEPAFSPFSFYFLLFFLFFILPFPTALR
ncbi:hypothetical protein BC940DRAFT_80364 [Gongronella butleri]|nr:hypothetical protein BC940DRAFT_80364 [Gongronella butleri]